MLNMTMFWIELLGNAVLVWQYGTIQSCTLKHLDASYVEPVSQVDVSVCSPGNAGTGTGTDTGTGTGTHLEGAEYLVTPSTEISRRSGLKVAEILVERVRVKRWRKTEKIGQQLCKYFMFQEDEYE